MNKPALQRVLSLILCALMCVTLLPIPALAEDGPAEDLALESFDVEAPIAEESIDEAPVAEETIIEETVAEEPVAEETVAEEPVAEETIVEESVAEETIIEETVVEETIVEETIVDTATAEAVTAEEEELEELVADPPEPRSLAVDVDMPDGLLDGYADQQLGSRLPRRPVLRAPKNVGGNLSGAPAVLYSEHKSVISQIAAGQRESTEIYIPLETVFEGKLTWTAEELGIDAVVVDGKINSDAVWAALYAMTDVRSVLTALLQDCPYELYWYDKTIGITYGFDTSLSTTGGQTAIQLAGNFFVNYTVASEYQNGGSFVMNTALGQEVQSAVNNAQTIVSTAASYSLVNKLDYYRQRICELVSYNDAAAAGGVSYGNPWQLIWIFDDDSSTNVVCEGYAKAFQYLCDLSNLGSATCYTVTGQMTAGTGAGRHMWNIVTMPDGKNYLVDITNCDSGSAGYPDLLFLKGYDSCEGYTSYTYSGVTYQYDESTLATFSEAELTLSDTAYGESGEVITSGQCGDNAYWDLTDGVLTISGTGAMANYGGPGTTPWYASNADIQRIVIEPGITSIGNSAFAMCSNMTSITIPDSVTGIGETAFYGCLSLPSIEIPASVTSIGGAAFTSCQAMSEIHFLGSAPTIGEQAFYGVTSTAYYPADDATWTDEVKQGYGGSITWVVEGGETPSAVITLECVSGALPNPVSESGACFVAGQSYEAVYEIRNTGTADFSGTLNRSVNWVDAVPATNSYYLVDREETLSIPAGGSVTVSLSFTVTDTTGAIYWGVYVYDADFALVAEDSCPRSVPIKDPADNQFHVDPVGDTNVYVTAGDPVTLQVAASAIDMDGITYRWINPNDWSVTLSDTDSYTVPAVTGYGQYYCEVTDKYGNSQGIWFYVHIDNQLHVDSVGDTTVYVTAGEPVTLQVAASAIEMDGITYRWVNTNDWSVTLSDTDSYSVPAVTEFGEYYCEVTDKYGNGQGIWFNVYVDNALTVRSLSDAVTLVPYGESAVLEIVVSARDEEGMSINWYRNSSGHSDFVGSGERYTIPSVTSSGYYTCEILDKFGNRLSWGFTVGVQNHLRAWASETGENHAEITCDYGSRVELSIEVSADEMDGLTYRWSQQGDEVSTEPSYVIPSLTRSENMLSCVVTDKYGNMASVNYVVNIQNHLAARINDGAEKIFVQPGADLTLTAYVSADDASDLQYFWDGYTVADDRYIDISSPNAQSIDLSSINEARRYHLRVMDKYGTYAYATVVVGIDNAFSAYPLDHQYQVKTDLGQTATLTVVATANDMTDLHYRWFLDNEFSRTDLGVDAPTISTVPINSAVHYICSVTDRFGNQESIYFTAFPENHLSLQPANNIRTVHVAKGGDATLAVVATADDMTDLHYQWYKMVLMEGYTDRYNLVTLPGETLPNLTVTNVQQAQQYQCEVIDRFGGSAMAGLSVGVENHLSVQIDNQGTQDPLFLTEYGGSATVSVTVSADEMDGMTYQWYRATYTDTYYTYELIEGATGLSYYVQDVQRATPLRFMATDKYGNIASAWPVVSVQNHLIASSDSGTLDEYGNYIVTAGAGNTVTLNALATADIMDNLSYAWYEIETYRRTLIGTESSCNVVMGTESRMFECVVTDYYGTTRELYFILRPSSAGGPTGLFYSDELGWVYYENGVINTQYTGLAYREDIGWWYVENGRITFAYTGLAYREDIGWWYVENSHITFSYTGLVYNETLGWVYCEGSGVNWNYTGLAYRADIGWWYVENGRITFAYTGLAYRDDIGWWFVENSALTFSYNGFAYHPSLGWVYCEGSGINWNYTGLAYSADVGWRYVEAGRITFAYNGLAYRADIGWWYVENSQITFTYTGLAYNETLGWVYCEGSGVSGNYTGLAYREDIGWWYVENGRITFTYTGLAYNEAVGWVYCEGSGVNWNYTGLAYRADIGWWYVENGRITFTYTGLACREDIGWWYIENSQITFTYTGTWVENGTVFQIENSRVTGSSN